MSRKCCISKCAGESHLFSWPKDAVESEKWTSYVKAVQPGYAGPNKNSRLCFRHFTEESISNLQQYTIMKDQSLRLTLVPGAIPTIVIGSPKKVSTPRSQPKSAASSIITPRRILTIEDSPLSTSSRVPAVVLEPLRTLSSSSSCQESSSFSTEEDSDSDWEPGDSSDQEMEQEDLVDKTKYKKRQGYWFDETKHIVMHENLCELLKVCPKCTSVSDIEVMQRSGAYTRFKNTCAACNHERLWETSPSINRKPVINLLISATTLFSGCLASKFLRALTFLSVLAPSRRTFHRHQKHYLFSVMDEVFTRKSKEVVETIKMDGDLNISGDGRFDSPGHSALYGTYTMMDTRTSLIFASALVKSTEVNSSPAMELEGLKRCRKFIEDNELQPVSLTTDQHVSIRAYMRDHWPVVKHYFDLWHVAKGLSKKLSKLSQKRVYYRKASRWTSAIINHLYYCVTQTTTAQLRKEMWLSLSSHICNVHSHDLELFPNCQHGPLLPFPNEDGVMVDRDWLDKDEALAFEMQDLLQKNRLLDAIDMASRETTSQLEAFHSLINQNCPKMLSFSYNGMLARLQLTIMHHNENCNREVRRKPDGTPWRVISRSKGSKLDPRLTYQLVSPTFAYVTELMSVLERHVVEGTTPIMARDNPPTLWSTGPPAGTHEQLEERRFTRGLAKRSHIVPVASISAPKRKRPTK